MPLPIWATNPSILRLTEEQYEQLPTDVCRTIEVVDDRVVLCESPTPGQQRVSRNLTMALSTARPENPPAPCIDVLQDTDVRYRYRNPHLARGIRKFTMRRPDIAVLRCLKRGEKLWSDDVLVAIEITSSDDQVDFNDKRAEYGAQRIPMYLIVVMDEESIHSVEEYRLDWSGRNYQLAGVHRGGLTTELPEGLKLDASFADLERV